MKRRSLLFIAVVGIVLALAAVGAQKQQGFPLLDWAAKAGAESAPLAVVIEMGLKDTKPASWSGRATAAGARIVKREGYGFHGNDKLIEPDGWEASSSHPIRLPKDNPAIARTQGIVAVGVVLQLADVLPEATLTIHLNDAKLQPATVPLGELLAGQAKVIWNGAAVVRRVSTASPLVTARTEDDFPAAAYGPDGTLWLAYISYRVRDETRRIEHPQLKGQPADFKSLYTPEFADQLFVRCYRDGSWSAPAAVTGGQEDLVRCAVAVEGDGTAWVVYSANRQGNCDLYARSVSLSATAAGKTAQRLGDEQRLTTSPGPNNIGPVACTDQAGQVWVAYQSWGADGTAGIGVLRCQRGKWTGGPSLPGQKKKESRWNPALAAGPDGKVAVAYDVYVDGDYDVHVAVIDGDVATDHVVAASPRFEARPSVVYDAKGRLWIAFEDGDAKWGKDYGAFVQKDGSSLYHTRAVRVACWDGSRLMQPSALLPSSTNPKADPDEKTLRYAYPKLGLDGKGRVWLTYRQKFGTRYVTIPGSYWLTLARRLEGDHWTEPVELSHSDGLLDSRPVMLPRADGQLLVIHNTDGRFTTPDVIDNQIYASVVGLPGEPAEPMLVDRQPGTKDGKEALAEREAVERIRAYRVDSGGKKYQLLRGEFHRHTEISMDGGPDGSLEDMFRYAIDAAALDWIGNTDHDNGNGREYPWWLTQKLTDAYQVPRQFTPMFCYERSVRYPHGHRNCVFAKRGVRTLPRLAEPDPKKQVATVHADDAKMLFRYLHELDGVCASHTSATSMGTDWRDNDPVVEPIVEIYQGDRMSYEYEGCPRAGYDPTGNKKPAQIGGWEPAGFIDLAFKKGYRFGFQSSSDHFSTHISFCIVLAESHDRAGILAALKKRHCYAATDDIIVDVRSGNHLMGDEFKTSEVPALQITMIGTKPLAQVDILKDSEVVATFKPGQREYKGAWTDPKPAAGIHYYYVRGLQEDGQIAWGSPMWIDYAK